MPSENMKEDTPIYNLRNVQKNRNNVLHKKYVPRMTWKDLEYLGEILEKESNTNDPE